MMSPLDDDAEAESSESSESSNDGGTDRAEAAAACFNVPPFMVVGVVEGSLAGEAL